MVTIFRVRTPFLMKGTPPQRYPPDPRSKNPWGGGGVKKRHFHSVLDPPLFSHCLRCANVWLCNGVGVDREREREWVTEHEKPGGGGGGGEDKEWIQVEVEQRPRGPPGSAGALSRAFRPTGSQPGRHWSTQHVHCCSALLSRLCCSVRCPTVTPCWPSVLTFISPLRHNTNKPPLLLPEEAVRVEKRERIYCKHTFWHKLLPPNILREEPRWFEPRYF